MEGKITGILYAVFRVDGKYKTLNSIRGFQKHMEREQNTPNADQEKRQENEILIGNSNVYKLLKDHTKDCKIRKNGNMATGLLLTASREYFLNTSEEQKRQWIEANVKFLQKNFEEGCIYAVLHNDETTPHIHALISQRAEDRKGNPTINNSIHFGGTKEVMRRWQDKYGSAMGEFNLSRGIRFSKATHVKIRQFYTLINDNMNMQKLDRVLEDAYRYNYIKEEYNSIAKRLEAYKTSKNEVAIYTLVGDIYRLSTLTTAPNKFYNQQQEEDKRKEVEKQLSTLGIDIDISYISREAQKTRKETSTEAFIRQVRETQLKREVMQLHKIVKNMSSDLEVEAKQRKNLETQAKRLKGDKDMYQMVIRTMSEYYNIPQQAIETIIRTATKQNDLEMERELKK